jgi:hypothetical protein
MRAPRGVTARAQPTTPLHTRITASIHVQIEGVLRVAGLECSAGLAVCARHSFRRCRAEYCRSLPLSHYLTRLPLCRVRAARTTPQVPVMVATGISQAAGRLNSNKVGCKNREATQKREE